MSKTAEFLIPPTMQLTPKHVDAMHLVKLFVRDYEQTISTYSEGIWDNPQDYRHEIALRKLAKKMSSIHETCKNFGF